MLFLIGFASSERIYSIPDGMSIEEYKQAVIEANRVPFLAFGLERGTWRYTTIACRESFPWNCYWGDIDPDSISQGCFPGEVKSNCILMPDFTTSTECSGLKADACCLLSHNNYGSSSIQLMCYCTRPTTECPGGYKPGERKCSNNNVVECSDGGSWEIIESCDYGCENGRCKEVTCQSHDSRKCYGNDVYWFDSCGKVEEIYERCEGNEKCENGRCVKLCDEGYIGSTKCDGLNVVQQYQKKDCSTEWKIIESCDKKCENGICISPECPTCPNPTEWSPCQDGKMERTIYYCDETTNYECKEKKEIQDCSCSNDNDCRDDEFCQDSVCKKLECKENQLPLNHKCVNKDTNFAILFGILIIPITILGLLAFGIYKIFIKQRK